MQNSQNVGEWSIFSRRSSVAPCCTLLLPTDHSRLIGPFCRVESGAILGREVPGRDRPVNSANDYNARRYQQSPARDGGFFAVDAWRTAGRDRDSVRLPNSEFSNAIAWFAKYCQALLMSNRIALYFGLGAIVAVGIALAWCWSNQSEPIRTRAMWAFRSAALDATITPDNGHVVAACRDGVRVFDLETEELAGFYPVRELTANDQIIFTAIAVSPDSQQFAIAVNWEEVQIRDIQAGYLIRVIPLDGATVNALEYTTDGKYLIAATRQRFVEASVEQKSAGRLHTRIELNEIWIWDLVDSGSQKITLSGHEASVDDVCTLGSESLVSVSGDSTLRIWDLRSLIETRTIGQALPQERQNSSRIRKVVSARDGVIARSSTLYDADSLAAIWDIRQEAEFKDQWVGRSPIPSAISAGGRYLITGNGRGKLDVWDIQSKIHITQETIFANGAPVDFVRCSKDGRFVVAGGAGRVPGFNARPAGTPGTHHVKLRVWRVVN